MYPPGWGMVGSGSSLLLVANRRTASLFIYCRDEGDFEGTSQGQDFRASQHPISGALCSYLIFNPHYAAPRLCHQLVMHTHADSLSR